MYPVVNEDTCIDCGMCVKVCPIVNECENKEPYQKSYGGYSKDERIIKKISINDIASIIAETIILVFMFSFFATVSISGVRIPFLAASIWVV